MGGNRTTAVCFIMIARIREGLLEAISISYLLQYHTVRTQSSITSCQFMISVVTLECILTNEAD